ncbi:MAG: TnpV protein [Finegoldia sp.]|uniref:TnpV protein n=1 Tax=Finegoldia sp. TaxID=1981334 RepID=UPI0039952166
MRKSRLSATKSHLTRITSSTARSMGQRHARYLKQHHKIIYINLLTSGKLNNYLVDIDNQAENLFLQLVKQLAESEDITEELKAKNQLEWVAQMNNVYNRAREIVNSKLIFI